MLGIKSVIFDDRIENWRIPDNPVPHNIMIYMVSGKVTYSLNGEKVVLCKGDVLFISEGTFRACDNDPEGPHQKYSAHFRGSGHPVLRPLLENAYLYGQIRNSDYFKQRFSMLLLEWFDRGDGHDLICEGVLLELLGLTLKSIRRNEVTVQKQELLNQLQTYILHNHCKPLRLTDLADHVQRSPNHITKIFRQVLKQTPIDYIHQVKISIGYEMLRNNRLTVAEVSDHLGYCEQSYFHRIFKKFTGVAPSAVQKGGPPAFFPHLPSDRQEH